MLKVLTRCVYRQISHLSSSDESFNGLKYIGVTDVHAWFV